MIPSACEFSSPIDAFNPDYKQYPKFRQAEALSFTQEAGDLFHHSYRLVSPGEESHQNPLRSRYYEYTRFCSLKIPHSAIKVPTVEPPVSDHPKCQV